MRRRITRTLWDKNQAWNSIFSFRRRPEHHIYLPSRQRCERSGIYAFVFIDIREMVVCVLKWSNSSDYNSPLSMVYFGLSTQRHYFLRFPFCACVEEKSE